MMQTMAGTPQMKLLTAVFMVSMAFNIKTVLSFANIHNHITEYEKVKV